MQDLARQVLEQTQRVQVDLELHPSGKHLKIRLESYDHHLGWYSSGALTLPMHQLPLLEQAIAEMRMQGPSAQIIPFPQSARERAISASSPG